MIGQAALEGHLSRRRTPHALSLHPSTRSTATQVKKLKRHPVPCKPQLSAHREGKRGRLGLPGAAPSPESARLTVQPATRPGPLSNEPVQEQTQSSKSQGSHTPRCVSHLKPRAEQATDSSEEKADSQKTTHTVRSCGNRPKGMSFTRKLHLQKRKKKSN